MLDVHHSILKFPRSQRQRTYSLNDHIACRSEFTVWHDGNDVYYVMHETEDGKEKPRRIRVEAFPVGSKLINELMPRVMEAVRSSETLRRKLFQANFHTTLSGESMITLIYHRKLDETWIDAARKLRTDLSGAPGALAPPHVIGRARKQKILVDAGEVEEVLDVIGRGKLRFLQVEGAFSQPNGGVCQSMLQWAVAVTEHSTDHDLLELYCGNGNFTTAVAPNFKRIVATEVNKSAVAAAKRNFVANGIENVLVARMSSEEFVEAWRSGRKYKRLENVDLKSYDFKTLLVDPPRAGLDDDTRKLLREFERVVYISCNPETLHRDILEVRDEFDIEKFAMFDQFPYTHHVECGVYLVKKNQGLRRSGDASAAIAEINHHESKDGASLNGEAVEKRGEKRKTPDGGSSLADS